MPVFPGDILLGHRNASVFRFLRDHSTADEEIDDACRGWIHEDDLGGLWVRCQTGNQELGDKTVPVSEQDPSFTLGPQAALVPPQAGHQGLPASNTSLQ